MAELADITERVERALEGLRPYLEADGGNISLVEVTKDHHVKVELPDDPHDHERWGRAGDSPSSTRSGQG